MVSKRKRTRTEKALALLKTGDVLREDSDDELGVDDLPWDWIYSGTERDESGEPSIVGARMGNFQCALGDNVFLKAAGNEAWVAMVVGFLERDTEDDDGHIVQNKEARFMWFSSEKEIKKKRADCLPVSHSVATRHSHSRA